MAIKIEEACARIGDQVAYTPRGRAYGSDEPIEVGVITSVSLSSVFVRYGDDRGSKATHPSDLDWPPESP